MLTQVYKMENMLKEIEGILERLDKLALDISEACGDLRNKNLVSQVKLANLKAMILRDMKDQKRKPKE